MDLYGKKLDNEGFIVEKDNEIQRVLTQKGEEIQNFMLILWKMIMLFGHWKEEIQWEILF